MESGRPVQQISGDSPAIHAYYDLCPESPDGRWVTYFEFLGDVPGPGRVVVARPDGSESRTIAESPSGSAHNGALQQWAGDGHVVFSPPGEGPATSAVASLGDEPPREVPGAVRMVHPQGSLALASPGRPAHAVWLIDLKRGKARTLLTVEDGLAVHPEAEAIEKPEALIFMNSKWSPDGRRFLTVFNNEGYRRRHPELRRVKSLLVGEADGSGLRYLKDFGHHPSWSPDGAFVHSYDRSDEGGQDMVAQPLDGQEAQVVLRGALGVHGTLSLDGRRLITDVYDWPEAGRAAILRYDLTTGGYDVLVLMALPDTTHKAGCHPHPVFSRDRKRVYFNSTDSGVPRLYAIEL
jgi:Tol biopolymer transport system component